MVVFPVSFYQLTPNWRMSYLIKKEDLIDFLGVRISQISHSIGTLLKTQLLLLFNRQVENWLEYFLVLNNLGKVSSWSALRNQLSPFVRWNLFQSAYWGNGRWQAKDVLNLSIKIWNIWICSKTLLQTPVIQFSLTRATLNCLLFYI